MKKQMFVAVLAVAGIMPCLYAQDAAVLAPIMGITNGFLEALHVDQGIYYLQSIGEQIKAAENTYAQFQQMIAAEKRALANLKGAQDIKSWDDFMNWTNRQLYLEKQAASKFQNMGIQIGDKNYKLAEIQKIPNALMGEYVDYWFDEFSEAQRKEMWTKLGLAPSNYVYLKAWQAKMGALGKNIMTKAAIWNEEKMKKDLRKKEIMDAMAADQNKPEDEKMGEKQIAQYQLEIAVDTNTTLQNIAIDMAEKNELDQAAAEAAALPPNPPQLSDGWNRTDDFGPITDD
jgi:hypothetical protein